MNRFFQNSNRSTASKTLKEAVFLLITTISVGVYAEDIHRDPDVQKQACTECHESPHRSNWPKNCRECHALGATSFKAAQGKITAARHGTLTGFDLTPPHDDLDCSSCHAEDQPFKESHGAGVMAACGACHENPHGQQFQKRTHCRECHQKFQVGEFRLANHTGFPLGGEHRAVACQLCHPKDKKTGARRFAGTPKDCAACHPAPHGKNTPWPLSRPHARAACSRCHTERGPARDFARRGCGGCHVDPHAAQMGPNCEKCHEAESGRWRVKPDVAGHDRTRFPLSGRHLALACETCHGRVAVADYRGLVPDCFGCHADDYATAPNHTTLPFPRDCERCHRTDDFKNVRPFHVPGSRCIDCHSGVFPQGPKHTKPGFPTDCLRCHVGFPPADFTGATMNHTGLTNCYACHDNEFNSAAATDHAARSYPTNCGGCHNTTGWARGALTHPPFVYQGVTAPGPGSDENHRGFSGDFFSCNVCHTTRVTTTVRCDRCHDFPPD